jgi:O-antigen ligase
MNISFHDRIFPSDYSRGPTLLAFIGVISLTGMIIFKIGLPHTLGRHFQTLTVLAFFLTLGWLRVNPFKDKAFQFLIVGLALPGLEFLVFYFENPEAALYYAGSSGFYRLMLFLPLAWWLGGRPENGYRLYALALAGLFIGVLLDPNLADSLKQASQGQRVDFGFRDAQHTGLLFGIAFLGVVILKGRIEASIKGPRIVASLCFFLLTSILLMGVIVSQTRAVWLALSLVFSIYIISIIYIAVKKRTSIPIVRGSIFVALAVFAVFSLNYESIDTRLRSGNAALQIILKGDLEQLPYSSIGIRVHYAIAALERIRERPWTGWGYGIRTKYVKESNTIVEEMRENGPQHVHNSYLSLLLSYGVLGLIFVLAIFIYLLNRAWQYYNKEKLPEDIFIFISAFTLFFTVVNAFESYLFIWSGTFSIAIVFAPMYTLVIKQYAPRKSGDLHIQT